MIVSVDQKPVTTPENAATRLKEAANQGNVLLLLNRHGMGRFVGLSVQNNGTAGSSPLSAYAVLRSMSAYLRRGSAASGQLVRIQFLGCDHNRLCASIYLITLKSGIEIIGRRRRPHIVPLVNLPPLLW